MSSRGVFLKLPTGYSIRTCLKFGVPVADESALRSAFGCKGSSGLKRCMLCQNVFDAKNRRDILVDDTSWAQDHTVSKLEKCVPHTKHTIAAIFRKLAVSKQTLNVGDFDELQTRLGWVYVKKSVMTDPATSTLIDPTQHVIYDWMHVFFVTGVFNVHMGAMMLKLSAFNISYSTLDRYVNAWCWPRHVGTTTGADCCGVKKAKSSWKKQVFNCQASEGRSLYPIFANWVQEVLLRSDIDEVVAMGRNYLHLTLVLELVESTARDISPSTHPRRLQAALDEYLSAYKEIYGKEWMTIKFHMALHLGVFFERWGCLPNCFALERKHKHPKRFTQEIRNTSLDYDASALREVTNRHISVLCSPDSTHFQTEPGLLDPRTPSKQMLLELCECFNCRAEFHTAQKARYNKWEKCSRKDVVLINDAGVKRVGHIMMIFKASLPGRVDLNVVHVDTWSYISSGARFTKWACAGQMAIFELSSIERTRIYSMSGGSAVVLMPFGVSF